MAATGKLALYANVGPRLTHYDVDVEAATLTRRDTIPLPANVQYAWPHANRRFLYVATSDGASGVGGQAGSLHHVSALRIDPASGALSQHGAPVALPSRPIHMATDIPSDHILVAFNSPGAARVYRVNPDFSAGPEIVPPSPVDAGIFPHQILATPDNRLVLVPARGHDRQARRPEEPGALKVYRFENGLLTELASPAPCGGYGFGPRHLDFHPTRPWIYVSLERQNAVDMFERDGDVIAPMPRFRENTLAAPQCPDIHQMVGTVHVHPNGRTVYVANRASDTVGVNGRRLFAGGENTIAVFAIDQDTGRPRVIQHAATHGIHPRTFHIDPSGRLMVAAHIMGLDVLDGDAVTRVATRLSVFRIADDGTLGFVRAYDIDSRQETQWWMGMVAY
jgi:6-phosphogluconolactonase (cycloisomerase 2 family)